MAGDYQCARPFGKRLSQWKAVGGGIDSDGNPIVKPPELEYAELILGLCRQFKKLPSEVEREDARILYLLELEQLGSRDERYQSTESDDVVMDY